MVENSQKAAEDAKPVAEVQQISATVFYPPTATATVQKAWLRYREATRYADPLSQQADFLAK